MLECSSLLLDVFECTSLWLYVDDKSLISVRVVVSVISDDAMALSSLELFDVDDI